MGHFGANIGVLVGAGGEGSPEIRSNAGALEDRFAHFSISDGTIDLLVTLTGSDQAVIGWLNDAIGELATLRAVVALRASGSQPRRASIDLIAESSAPRPTDLHADPATLAEQAALVAEAAAADPGEQYEPPLHASVRGGPPHYAGSYPLTCPDCQALAAAEAAKVATP